MNRELSDWLNRSGIVLGFISFWLAAPEFIGKDRLKEWEQGLAQGILRFPKTMRVTFIAATSLLFVWYITALVSQTLLSRNLMFPIVPTWILSTVTVITCTMLLSHAVVEPIVSQLANDKRVRQTALFFGAALFTISAVLQFAATFQAH